MENIQYIPSEKNFAISKVKLKKDEVIDLNYDVTEVIGQESFTNTYHMESAKSVHPDMRELFKRLNPIMARVLKLTSFQSVVSSPDFKATAKQVKAAEVYSDELTAGVHVFGLSYSGKGDNVKVVLTAMYSVANNQKVVINSPAIRIEGESWGFEEELNDIAAGIEGEVYAYLYKGKKAQLELFNGQNDGHVFGDIGDAGADYSVSSEVEESEEQGEDSGDPWDANA